MVKIANKVVDVDFSSEISTSYLIYSYFVIAGRAIPSIEDGLKPVQRRILWYMHENKMGHNAPTTKSAKISNSVIGSYHPHSDCYPALVNMGVPYISLPMITPKGSFGSTYGDTPAASRYTEAKLSLAGDLMLADIDEGVSPMVDNYDSTRKEPQYLAPRFPNLIINSTAGIAVGYACKYADHSPSEVMDFAIALAKRKDMTMTVDEILKIMPGPDFGTGGIIIGIDGIRDYYETGTGSFIIRGEAVIKDIGRGRSTITISSLPNGVKTESFIATVKKKVDDGTLVGITDVKNLTDRRSGLKVEITTKRGTNAKVLLGLLYKDTPLEQSFSVNATAIDKSGIPRTYSMLEMMQTFLRVREKAIVKRSQTRRAARVETVHSIEGMLKVIADIDKAISIIRHADDQKIASKQLMDAFKIDEAQAEYILGLQLRRLTKADEHELEEKKSALDKEISELDIIINNEDGARKALIDEMKETKKMIARDRICTIKDVSTTEHKEKLSEVTASAKETVQKSGPVSVVVESDGVRLANKDDSNPVSGEDGMWALYADGTASKMDPLAVSKKPSSNVLVSGATPRSEHIKDVAISGGDNVVVVTKDGNVKVVDMSTLPKTQSDSDIIPTRELVDVERLTKPYVLFVTSAGKALKIDMSKVRAQGRTGSGVAGINLGESSLVAAFAVGDDDNVITKTNDSIKVTPASDIPVKGRGTGGVTVHAFRKADVEMASSSIAGPDTKMKPTPRGKSGERL